MRGQMTDTLAAPASHALEIRHSRFLAHAAPVDGPAAALAFIGRVSDPDATAAFASFTYVASNDATEESSESTVTLELFDPADSEFAAGDLNPGALIVYNVNADGAEEIAEYYQLAREMDASRLCPVEMPNGFYASMDELRGARKQILEGCICDLIPVAQRPPSCGS